MQLKFNMALLETINFAVILNFINAKQAECKVTVRQQNNY